MNDQNTRSTRLRHTATGALAALAAVGAIAGTAALAAKPHANPRGNAAATNSPTTKTPTFPVSGKPHTPQQDVNQQPFLDAVQQLVDNGTITATEGQTLDREIQAGSLDPQTLESSGFTQSQIQAVEQALSNAKRALAPGATGGPSTPNEPPPAGTAAPIGGKEPPPAAPGNKSTPN